MNCRFARPLGLSLLTALVLLAGPMLAARAGDYEEMRDAFRDAFKRGDWKERRDAFIYLADYDRPETVEEILAVLRKEDNAAVLLGGVEALAGQKSLGSRKLLFDRVRKSKDRERLLVLVALGRQEGKPVVDFLVEIASGRDGPAAAQAAWSLEKHPTDAAVPALIRLLKHKDWQVRRAAAISLGAWREEAAVKPLAFALAAAKGRDRNELIAALHNITGEKFGNDPAAWKAFAQGTPIEEIRSHAKLAPTVFGVPIYGQRIVVCLDNSLRMTNPHPFDSERLRTLCDPLDGDPIPWFRMKTNGQFASGHVKHLLNGLRRGSKFELVTFNAVVDGTFGNLASLGTASRNLAFAALDALQTDDGINTYGALNQALDVAGAKDAQAWKSGPDEIVFITVNMPTKGDVKEADVVAASIALKARLRMVPIHAVGIHFHPYDMCRAIAEGTGGVYVALTE